MPEPLGVDVYETSETSYMSLDSATREKEIDLDEISETSSMDIIVISKSKDSDSIGAPNPDAHVSILGNESLVGLSLPNEIILV